MFKKIIITLLLLCSSFMVMPVIAGPCDFDGSGDVWNALAGCLEWSSVVESNGDFSVENNFKTKINSWTRTIGGVLWLIAVGAIVYGGLLMTISAWEDEKIKKWKDVVKWSIIWFAWVVVAGGLISILINFIFAIG